ncbi:ABC transporter ATP-binding protein [Uliginosibacterium sediminicola]|uniref:ABC transporter ATP-binding protein n=1 Tax=Uliginosibacterium sediminicola TaxID=2024550 RepID=A0ABU9YX93_9RHOO
MSVPVMSPALPLLIDALQLRAGGRADGRVLIDRLDLHCRAGERWVVLGPNGAGKSTLLAALAGLSTPTRGGIVLGGKMLSSWTPQALARQRAWCPQFWLDPFAVSAWETVASAALVSQPDARMADCRALAQRSLELLDAAHLADADVRTLSGGERQRVALATACAQAAPILLLDEPTAHLDWAHQASLQRWLKTWSAQGGMVIAAVHDLNLAWTLASHALLLDGRGGYCSGTREEVLNAAALQNAYGVPVSARDEGAVRWFRLELDESLR